VLLQLLRATQELVRAPDRRNAPLFGDLLFVGQAALRRQVHRLA
jgi:hypothetical protein